MPSQSPKTSDTGGCTGTCCAAFRIPHTPASLKRAVRQGRVLDGDQLLDMLIPLTPKEARERNRQFGGDGDNPFPWSDRGHHFTCRHWDEDTRLCTIYEERPMMCREFPYGKDCPFGCDCKAGEPPGGWSKRSK